MPLGFEQRDWLFRPVPCGF